MAVVLESPGCSLKDPGQPANPEDALGNGCAPPDCLSDWHFLLCESLIQGV